MVHLLSEFGGWLSDSGEQVVSINVTESNQSNRYHGEITSQVLDSGYPVITSTYNEGSFSYRYLGCSFSGVHLIQTWEHSDGSGVFCSVLLATLSQDSSIKYDKNTFEKVDRFVIKLIGSIPLGDSYDGILSYKFGFLSIPACKGIRSLRESKSTLLVL